MRYQRILQMMVDKPWAILPSKLTQISELMIYRANGGMLTPDEVREMSELEPYHAKFVEARMGNSRKRKGNRVAVVPVYGVITPRASLMSEMSGGTGMDQFMEAMQMAADDPSVSSIIMDVDSPGGQVDMVPEAAALVREIRQRKPVTAVANTMAASAGYWLASQANELVVSPSAEVGSIGVYAAHNDLSEAQAKVGIKTTLVSAGKYKTELDPSQPLSDEARGYIQSQVDGYYAMFLNDVAKGRGTSAKAVAEGFGQGRMVLSADAVKNGMADRVATLSATVNNDLRAIASNQQMQAMDEAGWIETRNTNSSYFFPMVETTSTSNGANVTVNFLPAPTPEAAAIPYKKTDVVDKPWDGPGAQAKVAAKEGPLRALHAWVDSKGDPNQKGSYKFPHHEVSSSGDVGAANVNGVRNALARLPQANIPDGDRAGVKAHLEHHLSDFNGDEESGETTPDNEQNESALVDFERQNPGENASLLAGEDEGHEGTEDFLERNELGNLPSVADLREAARETAKNERQEYLALLRRINTK